MTRSETTFDELCETRGWLKPQLPPGAIDRNARANTEIYLEIQGHVRQEDGTYLSSDGHWLVTVTDDYVIPNWLDLEPGEITSLTVPLWYQIVRKIIGQGRARQIFPHVRTQLQTKGYVCKFMVTHHTRV